MRSCKLVAIVPLLILTFALCHTSKANLINNSSFESPIASGIPTLPQTNWFPTIGGGTTAITSTVNPGYTGLIAPSVGDHHLVIQNSGTAPNGVSAVFQEATVLGDVDYTLSFEARSLESTFPIGAEFRIAWITASGAIIGDQFALTTPIASGLTDSYNPFSLTATAPTNAAFARVFFTVESSSASGSQGTLFVDNVSFVAVPEPGSAALFCLAGLAITARRRR